MAIEPSVPGSSQSAQRLQLSTGFAFPDQLSEGLLRIRLERGQE